MVSSILKAVGVLVGVWLLLIMVGYLLLKPLRPARTNLTLPLHEGVTYKRTAVTRPRPVQVHVVTIDLAVNSAEFLITSPTQIGTEQPYNAQTTAEFLRESGVDLAINAGFFFPFWSNHPFSFYPHAGDPVTPLGVTIADGAFIQTQDLDELFVLCINSNDFLLHKDFCPADTPHAVSGNLLYIQASQPRLPDNHKSKPLPRTMFAYNNAAQKVWIVVADGRQPLYSRGLTLLEMQEIAVNLGAEGAINLDGGGSSTLVFNLEDKPYTLNAPIHTRIPMRQRPVANHIGVRLTD